jgi:hypothetical protein
VKTQRIVVRAGQQLEIYVKNSPRSQVVLTQRDPAMVVLVQSKMKTGDVKSLGEGECQ